jgi:predicted PurR-regulated permease PerM
MTPRWSTTTKRTVAVIGVGLATLFVLHVFDIITPFIWAAVFAYVFGPLVGAAQRRSGAPRGLAVATLFAGLGLILYLLGRLLAPVLLSELAELRATFPRLVANVQEQLVNALAGSGYEGVAAGIFDQINTLAGFIGANALRVALNVLESILKVLIFVIALFYMLRDGPRLTARLAELAPGGHRAELLRLLGRINSVLGQYVRGQVVLIAIMATATTIGLSLLQVPFSFLIGLLTGVLETIPLVGPITAGAIAVLVALGHPAPFGWSQTSYAAIVAVMYTVFRQVEDYVVVPQVIGRIVELHPLLVIFALLAGGATAGLLGIVIAVPVAASLRLIVLYALAKLRDEDPYRVIAEPVAETEMPAAVERPA